MRSVFIAIYFGMLLVLPNWVLADCVDFEGFNNFLLYGGGYGGANTVVLYAGPKPIGQFDVPYCSVKPQSQILLQKSKVCDGDDVMINGLPCTVTNVKSSG